MQQDPVKYWQELSENYRQMSDGELLELAEDIGNLTEVAQQALRGEMTRRRLDERRPEVRSRMPGPAARKNFDVLTGPLENTYGFAPEPAEPGQEEEQSQEDEQPHDYTWKTVLRECDELVEARQLSEALKRAGIESWVEAMSSYGMGAASPRVLVPADRLEEAQRIAAQPIPREILEESQMELPEFVPPRCPTCGAPDPVLESADPVNAWVCEACGAEWTDSDATALEDGSEEKSSAP